jgi:sarcosine oxidase, subunit beta
MREIVLVDERPPLSLTSDKSTECYRAFWPGPGDAMVGLMNRSIDMLEDLARATGNSFNLNRRGYLYAIADRARIAEFERAAEESAALGAGPVRLHDRTTRHYQPAPAEGFEGQPSGVDLIVDRALIREQFPYLAAETVAVLHARRAGWLSAQQLGMYLLEQARERGASVISGRVTGIETIGGQVGLVQIEGAAGAATIATRRFVNAAGPLLPEVGRMLGVELPVYSELHTKASFPDHLRRVPRDAPMLIWADPQRVPWSDDERADLAESDETRWLLEPFPAGVHTRPDGPAESPIVLMLWDYHNQPVEPAIPPRFDPYFPELALRGLTTMLPGLKPYVERTPRPYVDGGYYTKTRENRPLIGPLPLPGAYVIGALSGFGVMAALAGAELLAEHLTAGALPAYAPAFALSRYDDLDYQELLRQWGDTGQL